MNAGIVGYQFGTVGVSDGISMGTSGSEYHLEISGADNQCLTPCNLVTSLPTLLRRLLVVIGWMGWSFYLVAIKTCLVL